jgi:hypothetical protein
MHFTEAANELREDQTTGQDTGVGRMGNKRKLEIVESE